MTGAKKNRRFDGPALGPRMNLLRHLRGMSLQAVADAAGLTKTHVWDMEQGNSTNPTVEAVWGLADALTVSPAQLLGIARLSTDKSRTPPETGQ